MDFSTSIADVLEALPLPVMVRNYEGVLIENRLWQEHQPSSPSWRFHHQPLAGAIGLEMIVAENISQHNNLEKQLAIQQTHLVQLQRIKDEFLACINHELRSPLTVVLGMTNLLEKQLLNQLTDRQRTYLKAIHRSSNHLVTVIDTMMDITKAETGQLQLQVSLTNVRALCEATILQIQQQDFPLPPEISLEIETNLDVVTADQGSLQQMLFHLLSNACRFTCENQPPKLGIRVQSWDTWIAFTVWDRGIGIAEEHQSLIFQKFQQVESPWTRRFDGTGLGLVLTRQLARLHGGDVTFTSSPGTGSEFTILLPPTPRVPVLLPSPQLVLIVDTIAKNIDHISAAISSTGFRPVVARSGLEALEKARQLRPTCVFLSNELPMLSGKDLLALLHQDHNLTKTVMVSFQSQPPSREKILALLPHRYPSHKILCIGCEGWRAVEELPFRRITVEDIEEAERLVPMWKPAIVMIGQERLLYHITENGNLTQVPIVVPQAGTRTFPHLNLFSCSDQNLMAMIEKLWGTIPHPQPY